MAEVVARLDHQAQINAALRAAPAVMKRELRAAHRQVGREARGWVRSEAASGTAQQRHMAKGIGSSANSSSVALTIGNTRSAPGAAGAFYGAKQYPQFPRWVGNRWKPAVAGQGPYVVNPALAKHEDDINTIFLRGQLDAVARAFPGGSR